MKATLGMPVAASAALHPTAPDSGPESSPSTINKAFPMSPIRSLLLTLVAMSALLAAGCKDSPTDSDSAGRSQLLVRSWKTVTVTANGFDAGSTYADVTTFNSDGTYNATYTSSGPKHGTWKLTNGDAQLVMDEGTDSEGTWTIVELTSTTLHMTAQLDVLGSTIGVDYTGVPK